MSTKDGGPAFPATVEGLNGSALVTPGMTLRDYFAAHAPAAPSWWHGGENKRMADVVSWRIAYADAMLAAREAP